MPQHWVHFPDWKASQQVAEPSPWPATPLVRACVFLFAMVSTIPGSRLIISCNKFTSLVYMLGMSVNPSTSTAKKSLGVRFHMWTCMFAVGGMYTHTQSLVSKNKYYQTHITLWFRYSSTHSWATRHSGKAGRHLDRPGFSSFYCHSPTVRLGEPLNLSLRFSFIYKLRLIIAPASW